MNITNEKARSSTSGYPRAAMTALWYWRAARSVFHVWLRRIVATRSLVDGDIERWIELLGRNKSEEGARISDFLWLLVRHPEFRNLFYYRAAKDRRLRARVLLELAKLFYRPLESLYIFAEEIGPRCFIQHGFSTMIAARSIGENFWVNQQVSIGYAGLDDLPTIGNNVSVRVGAIVLGDITIGDNAVIGAGAVVLKSVPPNCTVVGVPAYIVKRDGKRIREELP